MAKMGLQFGLETNTFENSSYQQVAKTCLRPFRWLLKLEDVCVDGVNALPPSKSSRPSISFGESEAKHLTETFSYPTRPEWKPLNLTLYDVVKYNPSGGRQHPVFDWLLETYDPQKDAKWKPATPTKKPAILEMYDGCGQIIESWVYENPWLQSVDFGALDMGNYEIMTVDLTIKYARAYLETDKIINGEPR